ncbi:MAG: alpha/beta hydrolase [Gammaproteobacteria bacterium]|nr:alpha/beta hydrolase [Gammaproteobacteria bacterium]
MDIFTCWLRIQRDLTTSLVFLFVVGSPGLLAQIDYQANFDSLGPTVEQLTATDGRVINYIDDANESGIPVVFTGGLGTSVRAVRLLDFLETMRADLNLRFITIERNGFGQTEFDENLDMSDYVNDVEQVLAHLNIEEFALFGISGGGPYTAKIAETNSQRLLSIHMAATNPAIGNPQGCNNSAANAYTEMLRYPMEFFGFPPDSPLHQIEGFQATAFDEAARAHNLRGQSADPAPLLHEIGLYCTENELDSAHITAPVYVYLGLQDQVLRTLNPEDWYEAYPNADVTVRIYPDGGHDVQYRHLDQILLDLAGQGDRILVCADGIERLLAPDDLEADDSQSLGLCVWQ